MGILGTIVRCLGSIQTDLISDNILYIELDKTNFDKLKSEIDNQVSYQLSLLEDAQPEFKFEKQHVPDMGKCEVLMCMGRKFVFVVNEKLDRADTFYLAFKTKII